MNNLQRYALACSLLFAPFACAQDINLKLNVTACTAEEGSCNRREMLSELIVANNQETSIKVNGLTVTTTISALDTQEDLDKHKLSNKLGEAALVKVTVIDNNKVISQPNVVVNWGEPAKITVGEKSEDTESFFELSITATR